MKPEPVVTLYTRSGCHLCEEARKALKAARRRAPFALEVFDIDQDAALRARYDDQVPVICINGRKTFKYHLNEDEFLKKLAART